MSPNPPVDTTRQPLQRWNYGDILYLKVGTPLSALMPAPESTTMFLAFARTSRNAFMSLDGPPLDSEAITAYVIDSSTDSWKGSSAKQVHYACTSTIPLQNHNEYFLKVTKYYKLGIYYQSVLSAQCHTINIQKNFMQNPTYSISILVLISDGVIL